MSDDLELLDDDGGESYEGLSPEDIGLESEPADQTSPADDEVSLEDTDQEAVEEPAAVESTDEPPPADDPQAPETWRKEAAAEWAKLPPVVRDEILKREQDIFQGIETYKQGHQFGQTMAQVLQPFAGFYQQSGVTPAAHVADLVQMQLTLAHGTPAEKHGIIQRITKEFNIDLAEMALEAIDAPYVDPAVQTLQQKLDAIESRQRMQDQQEHQRVRERVTTEIERFAADPLNIYFDEVAPLMEQFMRAGIVKDLKDAYDRAIWAHPEVRVKEQTRLQQEARKKAADKATAAKKAAGANVSTRAKSVSGTAPLGSIDETLEATLADIKSRG